MAYSSFFLGIFCLVRCMGNYNALTRFVKLLDLLFLEKWSHQLKPCPHERACPSGTTSCLDFLSLLKQGYQIVVSCPPLPSHLVYWNGLWEQCLPDGHARSCGQGFRLECWFSWACLSVVWALELFLKKTLLCCCFTSTFIIQGVNCASPLLKSNIREDVPLVPLCLNL